MTKSYLGDGAYAEMDEYGDLILTTEDGVSVTNRVVLEPAVLEALLKYVIRLDAVRRYLRAVLGGSE